MLIGQTIFSATTSATVYYSPWFPRGGNRGRMTCNVVAAMNVDDFKIVVESKNSESDDVVTGANTWTSGSITLTANSETSWKAGASVDSTDPGLLELVRFRYELKADSGALGRIHFRMLPPQWFTN